MLLFMTKVNHKTLATLNRISHGLWAIPINNLHKKCNLRSPNNCSSFFMSTALLLLQTRSVAHCHMSLQRWSEAFHAL